MDYSKFFGQSWIKPLDEAIQIFDQKIRPILSERKSKRQIFPEGKNTFRAFKECPYDNTRVVIIGQDPYHDPGSATGLCFDNKIGTKKMSPSLQNLLKEMAFDAGSYSDNLHQVEQSGSYLGHLPKQGVLLLNTALTVERAAPASHLRLWEPFTDKVIEALNEKDEIIWLLWGAKAQKYTQKITNKSHYFIMSSHPSPLSVSKECGNTPPFRGSRPFSKVNEILEGNKKKLINW